MNISNDMSQNKEVNLSYDVNNLYPNMRPNIINLRRPINKNQMNNVSQNNNNEYNNRNNYDMNEQHIDVKRLNQPNMEYNYNNRQMMKGNQNYGRNPYDNTNLRQNNEFNNNYNNINNNYQNRNQYNRNIQYEEINTDINDNMNDNKRYPYQNKININLENRNKYNYMRNKNNIHIIPESKYENIPEEYENDDNYNDNNYNDDNNNINYNNQYHPKKIDIILKQRKMNNPDYQQNNMIKKEETNLNTKNKLIQNKIERNSNSNSNNSFINALYEGIEVRNKNNNENNNNEDNKKKEENISDKKDEEDKKSFFSFFSAFENFKKNPIYKYKKFILIHFIVLLIFLIISIALLHLIYNYRENILNTLSDIFQILCDPRRIGALLTSFISIIFLGPIHHWYISIPILLLLIVFYIYMRKYLFKKRCKGIIEKIVKYLEENENNYISEQDIYKRFVQPYGISYDKFLKKYLVQLHKLRRNDNRLKLSSMKKDEKTFIFWELSE